MNKWNNFFEIINKSGNIEILKYLDKNKKAIQFNELKIISNPKKKTKFSTRTISESLKKLEDEKFIEATIFSKNKRKVIGYKITDKGSKTLEIINDSVEKYKKL
jgi:DNA-binding HxlR family transcriptional regulator